MKKCNKPTKPTKEQAVPYWWLSYADDAGFRGGCHIQAPTGLEAVARARSIGISPGGQVLMCGPLTASDVKETGLPINVLLTKEEIKAKGGGVNATTGESI